MKLDARTIVQLASITEERRCKAGQQQRLLQLGGGEVLGAISFVSRGDRRTRIARTGRTRVLALGGVIFTGALGSTEIARKNWEHFAIGTAISGITLVCGENVCGIDPQLVLDKDGKVKSSPEMDRRIETYKRYHEGFGETIRRGQIRNLSPHALRRCRFLKEEARLRKVGFKCISLKTGAYGMQELAMALRWGAEAKIDLLTIDGAPGGTGMSPWGMMNEWGVPTLYLQSLVNEFVAKLQKRKIRVPDLAMAGGFSDEASSTVVRGEAAGLFQLNSSRYPRSA